MSSILELSCQDCEDFDYEDVLDMFEDLYENDFEKLLDFNDNNENFLHLLVWNGYGTNQKEQLKVFNSVVEKLSVEELDLLINKPKNGFEQSYESPLHYALDEDNNIKDKMRVKMATTILNKFPLERRIELLSMKEDDSCNITTNDENIAVWLCELDEDNFMDNMFSLEELTHMSEDEYNKMYEMLCCVDDEGEPLFTTITDLELDRSQDIVKMYIEDVFNDELEKEVGRDI